MCTLFPLSISANGRHLVGADGRPFLWNADTAWFLFLKVPAEEAAGYLALRKAQGFNAVQVQLTGFVGEENVLGEPPFLPEGALTRPNERFFEHVDRVIGLAEEMGLALGIAPLWSGCCGEGWAGTLTSGKTAPLNLNGPEKAREFGAWLGSRFGHRRNILWILGGDMDPDNAREEIRQLALGLMETAPHQLRTYHASSTHSSTDVWPMGEPWLNVSMVYTYFRGFNKAWNKVQPDVYEVSLAEYRKNLGIPFFLGESTYEGEHEAWGSALQARKQAYWSILSGGCGHAYGSPNWRMPGNWREVADLPGAASLGFLMKLFASVAWWELAPDIGGRFLVGGAGNYGQNDLAVAAFSVPEGLGVVYLPSGRTIQVDTSDFGGVALCRWYSPRDGSSHDIGAILPGVQSFEPPDGGDWVLLITME